MSYIKQLILSIGAGLCIGVGCIVYLITGRGALGAFLFSLGLLTILSFNLGLYTGKVGYIPDNKPKYLITVLTTWVGNFIGTFISAIMVSYTRLYEKLIAEIDFVSTKTTDTLISLFILGIFCGMLMYIAVETYRIYSKEKTVFAVIVAILCVTVFILAGFEHCVADMFYFTLYNKWSETIVPLVIISIGNGCGGILINLLKTLPKVTEK